MMSVRGSSPKISSESVTEPASPPSRLVTFNSMSRTLLAVGVRLAVGWRGSGRRFLRRLCPLHPLRRLGELELAGHGDAVGQLLLDGVAHQDPAAFDARHRAFDQDQAALDVGLHNFEIERSHPVDAEVAGHLFVLERLARVLTAAGRADRAVRNRDAVGRAQAGKIPPLHAAGKPLAGRGAGDVDKLADHEMIGGDLGADRNERVVVDAEFGELALGLDLGDGEMAAIGPVGALHLTGAGTELQRHIAVLVLGTVADHLAIAETEHRHRHVFAGIGEQPHHADLLREHPGTHGKIPYRACYSLISTSTPAARSSFISASTVCGVGSTISRSRLWVRISNCSRLFLSTCGERLTVNFSILVGSGIGPRTWAPVRLAVATISRVDASRMRWSNALSRILMFWPFIVQKPLER